MKWLGVGPAGRTLVVLSLLALPAIVLAHGGEEESESMGMEMGMGADMSMTAPGNSTQEPGEYPPTYFAHPEHTSLIYAHIALMTVAWIIQLPIAVMFSLAGSRLTLPAQFVFLATNALGVVLVLAYDAQTPDLYPNNAHHKIGWIITWVITAQIAISLIGRLAGAFKTRQHRGHERPFIPIPTESPISPTFPGSYRLSNDSGQGTEANTESLRSGSVTSLDPEEGLSPIGRHKELYDDGDEFEDLPLETPKQRGKLALRAAQVVSSGIWRYLEMAYKVVDRIILPFGFVAIATGVITYARFFEGHAVFNGLAHWIKGGIFFWLGILNLGRWSGSFGDLGWAWNVSPQRNGKWRPTAEFAESFLIFFYGSTNIFLEHLGGWGGQWTAQDLEHMSITVLFLGGGLCGMLIESSLIRKLLNTTVTETQRDTDSEEDRALRNPPPSYGFSMNPIPALVIMILGIMMSSHKQDTMISSMVHKQWGNLLTGASFARGLTYIIMWLRPPTSILPSRPPTELLCAFGLMSGGVIFMASSKDCIIGMIHYGLDAMFFYTVVLGFTGLLMAWEIMLLALKGWSVRRERRAMRC